MRAGWSDEYARAMAQAAGGRITVVRADGKVLVDSEANAAEMENHRTRPELMQAFRGEAGSSIRRSATIGVSFLYVAVPAAPLGGAIRIAVPLSEIDRQVNRDSRQDPGEHGAGVSSGDCHCGGAGAADLAAALPPSWRTPASWRAATSARAWRSTGSSEFGQLAKTLNDTAETCNRPWRSFSASTPSWKSVERMRKDFVINVSHELRTPLASIQGYTETLIDGALDDPDHNMRFLGIIRHNAERLARLTEDLLTLSRIEQKRQKFEFESHLGERPAEGSHGPDSAHRGEERHPAGGGTRARRTPRRGATARPYRRF